MEIISSNNLNNLHHLRTDPESVFSTDSESFWPCFAPVPCPLALTARKMYCLRALKTMTDRCSHAYYRRIALAYKIICLVANRVLHTALHYDAFVRTYVCPELFSFNKTSPALCLVMRICQYSFEQTMSRNFCQRE